MQFERIADKKRYKIFIKIASGVSFFGAVKTLIYGRTKTKDAVIGILSAARKAFGSGKVQDFACRINGIRKRGKMKDPCKIIGHNLRILRDALGITQMEAARRIDISVSGYREIERGNANPTLRTVELIADGMGVPPLALIKEPLDSDKVQIIQAVILLTRAISHLSANQRKESLDMTASLIKTFPEEEEERERFCQL